MADITLKDIKKSFHALTIIPSLDLTVADGANALFEGKVDYVEQLGEVQLVYLDIGREGEPLVAKLAGNSNVERGSTMRFNADGDTLHIFDGDGRSFARERMAVAAE